MIKSIKETKIEEAKIDFGDCLYKNHDTNSIKESLKNKMEQDGHITIMNRLKKQDVYYAYPFNYLFVVSEKFKSVFEDKIKGSWYPTNKRNYHAFLLENRLSSLNIEKTKVLDDSLKSLLNYYTCSFLKYYDPVFQDHIEFTEYLYEDIELKSILSTDKFQKLVTENNITGLILNKTIWGTNDGSFYFFDSSTEDGIRNCYRQLII